MIFITVGTQPNGFPRLLNAVEELIRKHNIQDKVIAQIGYTSYQSDRIQCFTFAGEERFKQYIQEADVVIAHAGSGTLFNAIKYHKKVIAVARLHKYNEMVDDHQLELLNKLVAGGYILDGTQSLEDAWWKLKDFTPRENDFNNDILDTINQWIAGWMSKG